MNTENALTVRTAAEADIPLIRQLALATWPATYAAILSPGQLHYMLEMMYSEAALLKQMQEGHQFLLVQEGAEAVAFADYSLLRNSVYKLNKIYVLPGQQGKGTGGFLLEKVIDAVKGLKATSLWLNVNRHNPAKSFYEKRGFVVISEEDIDIGEGYFMHDYIMEKKLQPAVTA